MNDLILVLQILWKIVSGLFDNPFGLFMIALAVIYTAAKCSVAIFNKVVSR